MIDFSQGDIIKIHGFKNNFLIISKNAFIKATNVFHVCPIINNYNEGPLHILIHGTNDTNGHGSLAGTISLTGGTAVEVLDGW